jgi:hypothetical protein
VIDINSKEVVDGRYKNIGEDLFLSNDSNGEDLFLSNDSNNELVKNGTSIERSANASACFISERLLRIGSVRATVVLKSKRWKDVHPLFDTYLQTVHNF